MGRIIKLLVYFIAYQFAVFGILAGGYMALHGTSELPGASEPAYRTMLLWGQIVFSAAVCVHLIAGKYVDGGQMSLRFPHSGKTLLASVALIAGMGAWTNYLNELAGLPDTMKDTTEMMLNSPIGIAAVIVMAPLMEELLFRGAMQGYLLKRWKSPVWAVTLPALLFGAVHGNPAQIPFAFVTGLALGWIYYLTGSLLPAMLMHFVNNGASVLLYHFSGNPDATIVGTLGHAGGAILALSGAALTALCVWYIKSRLLPGPPVWNESDSKTRCL